MTLREYLAKEGLSYRAAGERWGVHWTRVSQLCSGKRRPRNATRTWLHVLTKGAVGVADADWPLAKAPAPSAWEPEQKKGPQLTQDERLLAEVADRDLMNHDAARVVRAAEEET